MDQGRILVIRGGAIGDFVLTLPVFSALRRQFPDARLELLGYPNIAQLAREAGLVDAVRPIESAALAGFFARNGNLDPDLHDYFRGFDVILSYLFDPDDIFRTNVHRCLEKSTQYHVGQFRPDETLDVHATDVLLESLQRLAIFDADSTPRLSIQEDVEFLHCVHRSSTPWIAVHPGSGSPKKNWSEEHWIEFLESALDRWPLRWLVVGGEAEMEFLDELQGLLPEDRCRFCINRSLIDLSRMLKCCAFFIGHDSGITHVAAAVGLPVMVLWGGTRHTIWQPKGNYVRRVDSGGNLRSLPVESVGHAFVASLQELRLMSR